jgi:hypothetical protein
LLRSGAIPSWWITGSASTAGFSKEAKTSSELFDGVEVGDGLVVPLETSVEVAVGASVTGVGVAVDGGAVSLGAGVVGGAVGVAHPPSVVATSMSTSRGRLTGWILFIADDLLTGFDGMEQASKHHHTVPDTSRV